MNISSRPNTPPNNTRNDTITERHKFKSGAYLCADVCSRQMEAPLTFDKKSKSTHQVVLSRMNTPPNTIQDWVEFSIHYGNTKAEKYNTKQNATPMEAKAFTSLMNDVHTKIRNGDTSPAIAKLNDFTNDLNLRITVANGSLPNNQHKMLTEIQQLALCIKEALTDALSTEKSLTPTTSQEALSSTESPIIYALTAQNIFERSRLRSFEQLHQDPDTKETSTAIPSSDPPPYEDLYPEKSENLIDPRGDGISDLSDPDDH